MNKKKYMVIAGLTILFVASCVNSAFSKEKLLERESVTPIPKLMSTPITKDQPGEKFEPKLKIKVTCITGQESIYRKYAEGYVKNYIEEVIPRAKVTLFPDGTLTSAKELYPTLLKGVSDYSCMVSNWTPGVLPLDDLFSLPGLFPNQATSGAVVLELYRLYPEFLKAQDPKLHWLGTQVLMRADLHTTKPIRTVEELKGKVIACQDEKSARAMRALGASVSMLPGNDMYTAGERGVVDGVVVAWGSVDAWKLDEVYRYHTLISICPAVMNYYMTNKMWNKLTASEKQRLDLLKLHIMYRTVTGNVYASLKVRTKVKKDPKQEIIEWSPADIVKMRKIFKPIWDKWAEEMEKKGYPGKSMLKDAIKLVDAYIYG